jgi:opacity protein-like surface antigen
MKKLFFLLAGVFLAAVPAAAQNDYPRVEVFGGYSFMRTDLILEKENAHGWNASVAGNLHRNFGLEADFSGHYGSTRFPGLAGGFDANFSNYLFLAGPKVAARFERVTPWAHTLFGVAHTRVRGQLVSPFGPLGVRASDNNFVWAVGGGLDANVHKNVALRVVQADYIFVHGVTSAGFGFEDNSHNLRLSFGVVFKWGGQ